MRGWGRVWMPGSGVASVTHAFPGWFGPRGLASILYVFLVLVLEEIKTAASETIFHVAIVTVLAGVFAHGLSAGRRLLDTAGASIRR